MALMVAISAALSIAVENSLTKDSLILTASLKADDENIFAMFNFGIMRQTLNVFILSIC